jgi:hypothetical protein
MLNNKNKFHLFRLAEALSQHVGDHINPHIGPAFITEPSHITKPNLMSGLIQAITLRNISNQSNRREASLRFDRTFIG